jgi:ribonucleoside-diphosphate reductase alpha chain
MEFTPQTALAQDVHATQALSIRRRFTTPGVHPFDTVEWELRDARIGHGDKVAFEQADVEFPTSWSQNATNIVAQKYFRGQLDTPARERSVKQMIGRVAGTIADWGRSRGYFATAEDGDAFEAELTYVLLHQMAAFNSPVWFNVGFEDSPQCSACQPWHARVSTPEGMVPIGELVDGEQVGREVYDANGVTRVVAVNANGVKPVMRVRLRNGSFVEATPDHVVKAVGHRGSEPRWLRVDQLEVGMRMHLHPHRAKVGQPALVAAGGPADELLDSVDAVQEAEAALAGWLQADGFVGQYELGTNRSLTIEFQVADDDEYEYVMENLDVALPDIHRKVREADTQDTRVRRIRLYGEVVRDFVERWRLIARGTEIRVPDRLWTVSHDVIAAYLPGRRVGQPEPPGQRLRERPRRVRGHQRAMGGGRPAAAQRPWDLLAAHAQGRAAYGSARHARARDQHRLRARALRRARRIRQPPQVGQALEVPYAAQLEALPRSARGGDRRHRAAR